jgi:lysophospholipid acyltransferase (LPLAT)-like uncharacterized protein
VRAVSSPPPEAGTSQRSAHKRRSSGVVVPNAPRWHQRLGAWLVFLLVRAVSATLRYQWTDLSDYFESGAARPAIYCVWHNRLALCLEEYYGYAKKRSRAQGMAAMVSASKDGAFLAAVLECFGVQPVRGSTSRRGPQALIELTSWAERGYDLAITPDGPRGPCYVVQEGVIGLAQITGLPIIPASYSLAWKIRPRSWDRFQIPLPFSRCEMVIGPPLRVPREASDAEREALRQQLERALREITRD